MYARFNVKNNIYIGDGLSRVDNKVNITLWCFDYEYNTTRILVVCFRDIEKQTKILTNLGIFLKKICKITSEI